MSLFCIIDIRQAVMIYGTEIYNCLLYIKKIKVIKFESVLKWKK